MVQCASLSDLCVLDRQRACLNWQQQHQQQLAYRMYHNNGCSVGDIASLPTSMQSLGSIPDQIGSHGNGWPNVITSSRSTSTGEDEKYIKEWCNNPRKRKAENISNQKVGCGSAAEDGVKDKRVKEETKSQQAQNAKPPKTDYIHVRARRGQATDSHSLAERVRREKISERMKYLQDLVPGCNKITGKAGILDQIINYVQSLQRQVEFLSMKLASVNTRVDFNIDNFFNREMNLACNSGVMPMIDMPSEELDPSYIQFNPLNPTTASCGLDMAVGSSDVVLHRTMSMPASAPETILESSPNVHGTSSSSSSWDSDLHHLYVVAFHQGIGPAFPFQSLQGDILTNNLEMEM